MRKVTPNIYYSYREPSKWWQINWVKWKDAPKWLLWWYNSPTNQLVILYPIFRKYDKKVVAFLQAPCWNLTCYDTNTCIEKINYSLSCETLTNKINYLGIENILWKIKINWNQYNAKIKIDKIKVIKNWKIYNLSYEKFKKFKLPIWKYTIQAVIINPYT